jgi:hypothetical protein
MDDHGSAGPRVRYDPGTGRFRVRFDPDSESVSDVLVYTMSEVTGQEPDELESIHAVVDPVILDALVRRRRRQFRLEFVYGGWEVTLESHGELFVGQDDSSDEIELTVECDDSAAPSDAVIRGVAALRGVAQTDLGPLYEVVEPASLDRLFETSHGGAPPDLHVRFRYEGLWVDVSGDGTVTIRGRYADV